MTLVRIPSKKPKKQYSFVERQLYFSLNLTFVNYNLDYFLSGFWFALW